MKIDRHFPDPPYIISHQGFNFNLGKKLGEGGFAKCFEVVDELSGKRLALKAIFLESVIKLKAQNKLLNEIEIHQLLDHRHIVKLYKVFHDDKYIYLLMELCENKTMIDLIKIRKTLTENEVRQYIWMILSALDYLHSRHIIHRDLKLGNLFLNLENEIKVGDFGLATTLDQLGDRKKTICGTPNYIAPEILFDKERGHSVEVDIWALGVIMYTLLFGIPPFQSEDVKNIYRNIRDNLYSFPSHSNVSSRATSLISLMLTSDPDKRPKVKDLIHHSFFDQVIIKEPSYDDVTATRMFILNSITSIIDTSTITTLSASIGALQNHQAFKPARLSIDQEKIANHTEKENIKQTNTLSPATTTIPLPLDRKPGLIESIYYNISNALAAKRMSFVQQEVPPYTLNNEFFIADYFDYSSKYGLGYICSDGNIGAYFNDATMMILNPNINSFEYLYQENNLQKKQFVKLEFTCPDYPSELSKKLTVIRYFQGTFENVRKQISTSSKEQMEFLVKYAVVDKTLLFRLSTRNIQVVFSDKLSFLIMNEGLVFGIIEGVNSGRIPTLSPHQILVHKNYVDRLFLLKTVLERLIFGK